MRGQQAVKGEGFASWRGVGQVAMTVRVHEARSVDELILLDIGPGLPDKALLTRLADRCFFPLAVGGGIRSVDQAAELLHHGADKVVLNTGAVENEGLISCIANKLGSQSVCLSIDVMGNKVWTHSGTQETDLDPVVWARRAEALGAGEILVNDVVRDGTMKGYNLDLVEEVASAVRIPVIACGGARDYDDMSMAVSRGAHAVAAGALWTFTAATPADAARHLRSQGVHTRCNI